MSQHPNIKIQLKISVLVQQKATEQARQRGCSVEEILQEIIEHFFLQNEVEETVLQKLVTSKITKNKKPTETNPEETPFVESTPEPPPRLLSKKEQDRIIREAQQRLEELRKRKSTEPTQDVTRSDLRALREMERSVPQVATELLLGENARTKHNEPIIEEDDF